MKGAPRLYVKSWLEAVHAIEGLRSKGFTECYAKNPVSGKRKKIDIKILRMIVEMKNGARH